MEYQLHIEEDPTKLGQAISTMLKQDYTLHGPPIITAVAGPDSGGKWTIFWRYAQAVVKYDQPNP
ncbi:MAG TPA: hypothetical protein VL486_03575 [Verrucomicrobiae bacterium]|nr:hypothetical protein [Verrucomicrobiae bacterium]